MALLKCCIFCASAPSLHRESTYSIYIRTRMDIYMHIMPKGLERNPGEWIWWKEAKFSVCPCGVARLSVYSDLNYTCRTGVPGLEYSP